MDRPAGGLACLSPGFQTHDPVMREQLQRSLSVRDQQRSIIELEDGRLVERSNFRGRGRLCIRGEDPGSFFTVTCGIHWIHGTRFPDREERSISVSREIHEIGASHADIRI
jgi:hypothetical protein